MMGILFLLSFGLIAGLVAWAATPGSGHIDLLGAIVVGLSGSFIGASFMSYVVDERVYALHRCGIVGSVAGAVCLLFAACGIFSDNFGLVRASRSERSRIMQDEADRRMRARSPRHSPFFQPDRQSHA